MMIAKRAIGQKGKSLDPCGKIRIAKTVIILGDRERKSKYFFFFRRKIIIRMILLLFNVYGITLNSCNVYRSRTIPTSRYRTTSKVKSKKKKRRKRIIESDNQSDNEEEDEPRSNDQDPSENVNAVIQEDEEATPTKNENVENIIDNLENVENTESMLNTDGVKEEIMENAVANTDTLIPSQLDEIVAQKRKKVNKMIYEINL